MLAESAYFWEFDVMLNLKQNSVIKSISHFYGDWHVLAMKTAMVVLTLFLVGGSPTSVFLCSRSYFVTIQTQNINTTVWLARCVFFDSQKQKGVCSLPQRLQSCPSARGEAQSSCHACILFRGILNSTNPESK